MKKDNRVRINKKMMAWSNGERVNVVPSIWRTVDDYGRAARLYQASLREGDEYISPCTIARERSQCHEYEADRYWERGRHSAALTEMLYAALQVLPDDEPLFEDMQWLSPEETPYWNPNVQEFMRLMRRCCDYCKQDARLRPLLEDSICFQAYRDYLDALGRWARRL